MLSLSKRGFAVLCAYALILGVTIAHHEPWADEAQAWLMARDSGFRELVWHRVRYEGTPGLWHALLWIPSHLHLPYEAMGWLAGLFALAGVWMLLRWAPFPFWLKALLPFTYFLQYQYAAIARSYVLFPLLGFAAAHLFRQGRRHVLWLAVVLGLMANLSAHGLVVSAGIGLAYVWYAWRRRPSAPNHDHAWLNRREGGAILLYAALACVAVAVARPPVDINFPPADLHNLHLVASAPDTSATTAATTNAAKTLEPAAAPTRTQSARARLLHKSVLAIQRFSFPLSKSIPLAVLLCGLVLWWLVRQRKLGTGLPLLMLSLFFCAIYMADWHTGLLFVTILIVLWMAWPASPAEYAVAARERAALLAVLAVACLAQLPWTFHAVRFDLRSPYSGAAQTAAYLKTLPAGSRIFGYGYHDTAVEPYFPRNIYQNQGPGSYWLWSKGNTIDAHFPDLAVVKPDAIVLPWISESDREQDRARALALGVGYRVTHRFCGEMVMRDSFKEHSCYDVLEPSELQAGTVRGK